MHQIIKKIVAKEFLYLLSTTLIYFAILFTWTILSESSKEKEYQIKQEIQDLTEPEKLPFRLKMFHFLNNDLLNTDSWEKMEDPEKFISDLKTNPEIISTLYSFVKEKNKTISKEIFENKINNDTESETYLAKIIAKEKELEKTQNSIFNNTIGDDELLWLGVTLFSFIFLLRYIIYGTKWSFKQLKE